MILKELGRTGVVIPPIMQGCGFNYRLSREELSAKAKVLREAVQLGFTLIDTAEAYGDGTSEELVAAAVRGLRSRVLIATKVSPQSLGREALRNAAENSLRRLQTEYIDLYQIHWPNPAIPLEETMEAMRQLIDAGKVRYCGLSNFPQSSLHRAQAALGPYPVVSIQVEYNLVDRGAEHEWLPRCEKEGISLLAYSPLARAKSSITDHQTAALKAISTQYECTIAQLMIAWLVRHTQVVPVVKSFTPENIALNIQAASILLDDAAANQISALFEPEQIDIEPARIRVVQNPDENRRFYETFEEAMQNPCGYTPSPLDLAEVLRSGEMLKPIKVVRNSDPHPGIEFNLVEGQVRYWAHVAAFGDKRPIRAIVRLR